MPGFPTYDAAGIDALDNQAAALLGLFGAQGYARQEPAILQPAGIFLDRSGEEIRRRIFTLTDPSGHELCLRPDLTIPTCKHAVDARAALPARLCYNGLAFRYQSGGQPAQFFQAGIELLGVEDRAAGDREVLSLAVQALRAAGLSDFSIKMGDLALFGALVDALNLPPHWRSRLKRHFWRAGYVETLLNRIGQGAENSRLPGTRAQIETLLDAQAGAPQAGRAREEVVTRALAQAAEVLKLDGNVAGAIVKLLDISGPAHSALAQIRALLKTAGIRLDTELAAMQARLDALTALGVDPARVEFVAHFGRSMEYYTGFVFELWARSNAGVVEVAGGGRYDNMLALLGAPRPVTAVGCAIRTEALLAAARFAGGGA